LRNSASSIRFSDLKERYDVPFFSEDEWHRHTGFWTGKIIAKYLPAIESTRRGKLLNAGCGVYSLEMPHFDEVCLDMFSTPLLGRDLSVCANVEQLPFRDATFEAVVCVGEVLAYCDPATTIAEISRVTGWKGVFIFDFGSSRSAKHLFTKTHGRAADIVTVEYNGSSERTWVYDLSYLSRLLNRNGFSVVATEGTHTWSALSLRFGARVKFALRLQKVLEKLPIPGFWADTITVVAEKTSRER